MNKNIQEIPAGYAVSETPALYTVSYKNEVSGNELSWNRSTLKLVRVWKKPARGRLEILIYEHEPFSRYDLERLMFREGNAYAVCRRVRKSGNYIITPLGSRGSLMKELKYFGKKFKPIFQDHPRLCEKYSEEHFFDLDYCWKENLI